MDADLSHRPEDIPRLLEAMNGHDMVIGSRFIKGGHQQKRGIPRELLTWISRRYINFMLNTGRISDPNSGFKCYRSEVISSVYPGLRSKGPQIVEEVLYNCRGYKIKEVPISFDNRKYGRSKISLHGLWECSVFCLKKFKARD
jgi:dolichol-phosphate mannosyltransferase